MNTIPHHSQPYRTYVNHRNNSFISNAAINIDSDQILAILLIELPESYKYRD